MKRVHTDRSRIESFQRCPRLRLLSYHQDGMGIDSVRKPLPLCVGSSVHVGLATLLIEGSKVSVEGMSDQGVSSVWRIVEEAAVNAARIDFQQYDKTLQVDLTEGQVVPEAQSQFDEYLFKEQSALVEGLVRAYARRRLRPLLEQFEVLEVEREGEWRLHEEPHHIHTDEMGHQKCVWCEFEPTTDRDFDAICYELWFMSRPDALLLERSSNQLYLLSFKTAASWDIRKARDAEHDMQGLSEGIEIERRLATAWSGMRGADGRPLYSGPAGGHDGLVKALDISEAVFQYLACCDAPPRILAVRYEYMLKGKRDRDKKLSALLGFDAYSQNSRLVRGYIDTRSDVITNWNCSWNYVKPDGTGETSKLNYRQWKSEPVWEHMPIAQWIDLLADSGEATSGDTGQLLGIKSAAQATGYLARDPLDELFIPPVVIFRNEDDLRDLVEQVESIERKVAESVVQVESATDAGEKRHLLNTLFPQTRRACEYPSTCSFVSVCYGGDEIRADPLSSGKFKVRVPNHPIEAQTSETLKDTRI